LIYIPKGWYGKLEARSSMALKGIVVSGTVVDRDRIQSIEIHMINTDRLEDVEVVAPLESFLMLHSEMYIVSD